MEQRYELCVEVGIEAVVEDFVSYQYFQSRKDSAALSLWTRSETYSLQEQALSSELPVIAGYSARSHTHSHICYPVRHTANWAALWCRLLSKHGQVTLCFNSAAVYFRNLVELTHFYPRELLVNIGYNAAAELMLR